MLESFLPNLPTLTIMLGITLGGLWIFKRTNVKQLGDLQEKVIATYKAENDVQATQIKTLAAKVKRLEETLATLKITLKKRRGLLIEIDDEVITLIDQRTGAEHTVKINITDQHEAITIDEKKE